MFWQYYRDKNIKILPSTIANEIQNFISLMIDWNVKYFALFDNDKTGIECRDCCHKFFNNVEALKIKTILTESNVKTEDLFTKEGQDKIMSKFSDINRSVFKKFIPFLFYIENKTEKESILNSLSKATKDNFKNVYNLLQFN